MMIVRDSRWWRFLLIGGLCFVTNLLTLYVATDLLGLHYLVSMLVSIVIANTLGWVLNRQWTFRSSAPDRLAEYSRYLAVALSSSFTGFVLMAVLVSGFGVHYLIANCGIAAALTVWNFVAHRGWSFARGDGPDPRA